MNADRLLKLAEFLDNLPPKVFNIDHITNFAEWRSQGTLDELLHKTVNENFKPCGAVACAVGWLPACFPDEFQWDDETVRNHSYQYNFTAAENFFDIDVEVSNVLFCPGPHYSNNPTPKDVAAQIRKYLDSKMNLL